MNPTLVQPVVRAQPGSPHPVVDDLAYLRTSIVNVFFYGPPGAGDRGWVLIDAGMYGSSRSIADAAARRFGRGARPAAIILTHGHFDHVGALPDLAEEWDVPVYVHELELPYVTGRSSYPPPDPTVGGARWRPSRSSIPGGRSTWATGSGPCPRTGPSPRCRAGGGSTRRGTPPGTSRSSGTRIAP